jgi:hypothetical protein
VGGKRDVSLENRPENAVTIVTHINLTLRYLRYHQLPPLAGGKGGNWTGYSCGAPADSLGWEKRRGSGYADTLTLTWPLPILIVVCTEGIFSLLL